MPELAAIYFIGMISCLALSLLYVFLRTQRRRSEQIKLLQKNLHKAGFYWSENAETLKPWSHENVMAIIEENKKSDRNTVLTGVLLSLLSWAGAFFLLVIMLSERFLAQSRKEKKILDSELTRRDLDAQSVVAQLRNLELT
ncbi:MAG: hypothetical protein V4692_13960 [Bdellovibrionota bacterium]